MKTPIVYYGGKTSMLPIIVEMVPTDKSLDVYTEAFFGGGALFWAKKKVKNETINDNLDFVVNFYRQLKTNFKELKTLIDATLFSRTDHDRALLIWRHQSLFSPVDKAWALWMASNFSYGNKLGGGLKYSNDQGQIVPRVMQNMKKAFTEDLVKRIEDTYIENRDALQILESRNVANAFHYIDPPYENADTGHYKKYKLFENLLQWCQTCKGAFLMSNYKSDLLTEYVEKNGWQTSTHTFRNKGMRTKDREKFEILVWNYELPQRTLFHNHHKQENHALPQVIDKS